MKLRNINIIVSREYMTRVRKKSFLLTTFLVPIIFAALCVLPSVIMYMAEETGNVVAVSDNSGIIYDKLIDTETIDYVDCPVEDVDSVKANLADLNYQALVVISPLDTLAKTVSVSAYSLSPLSVDLKSNIGSAIDDAVEDYRVNTYDIDNLQEIMSDIKSNVSISTYVISEEGDEKMTSSEVYMIISLVLSMVIYMFIAMFSGMVMQSVIEEKASRVVEVLVSSVKATELMFGKIIGVACVALTQFFLWVVLTIVLVVGVSSFVGFDTMMGPSMMQTEQISQMTEEMGVDAAALQMADPQALMQDGEAGVFLSTLRDLDYTQILVSFIVYFVLGYLLYASFFAAIGSAVENEADTQQLQIPVTIPLLLAFFIAFYAFKSPDSQIVFWGSLFPFTSPIVMLARIPFGVPTWELVVSIVLLVVTFMLCAWVSAKIYKIGILMFGKKSSFKDLYKWLKQK